MFRGLQYTQIMELDNHFRAILANPPNECFRDVLVPLSQRSQEHLNTVRTYSMRLEAIICKPAEFEIWIFEASSCFARAASGM